MMPKGAKMLQTMQRWIEDEEERRGYMRTKTPLMAKKELYVISDHWNHYKEGMFVIGNEDDEESEVFALRPMTCPFQYYVYKQSPKSYRDLPCRYGETSTLFRNEESGEMHGLTRVRQFTISEGHLLMTPEQVEEEFAGCLDLAMYCLKTLGLDGDVSYRLSKWDPNNKSKYLGDEKDWESMQNKMREMLIKNKVDFTESEGEAAFYGPKLDIQAKNVYGKEDTMITIQLDFVLAERFDMTYTDANGEKKRPYIIHRTSIGCYERTLAWLIEKYAGMLPTWLCPEQVRILPISEKYHDYAQKVKAELQNNNVLVTVDERAEKIGYKIREARLERIPYMLVVGQKEEEDGVVSVRSRKLGDEGQKPLNTFIEELTKEIRERIVYQAP
jgi:threonyl-tRNA synthetase